MNFYKEKNFNCFSTSSKAHHQIRCDFFIDTDDSDRQPTPAIRNYIIHCYISHGKNKYRSDPNKTNPVIKGIASR
jgi:hypothetical protein